MVKPAAAWYFSKERAYRYKDIRTTVLPGVFHPHLIISTKLLLEFLEPVEMTNKSFLELGCGSGIISVQAALKGAKVTASDINPKAAENAAKNAAKNNVELQAIESDLFDKLTEQQFDFIVINPPYYPANPDTDIDYAWFCGENFEYFTRLFSQLRNHLTKGATVYMILSQDCELEKIQSIAQEHNFEFKLELEKKVMGEVNYIFSVS